MKNNLAKSILETPRAVFHKLGLRSGLGPLSPRAVALTLFTTYLMLGPVAKHSDVVSAALAYGLLGVISVAAVVVLAQSLLLRRMQVALVPPAAESVSGEAARVAVVLPSARILPFTLLEISLESPIAEFPKAALRVTGFSAEERRLTLDLAFPHRGSWEISAIHCELRDAAGLVRVVWRQAVTASVLVIPPAGEESRLPLVSSTQRPGDMVTDTQNRQGDPFDIKAYHPSDGLKKIVWKAFAKRGELLSRHPEASMTPEGFVVMLVLARPEDDNACSAALSYAQATSELGLDIVLGCEGIRGRSPARSVDAAQTLLVDAVWDAQASAGASIEPDTTELIDYCTGLAAGLRVRKLLLFCAGSRVSGPDGARLLKLAAWLAAQGIEPIFALSAPARLADSRQRGFTRFLSPLILEEDRPTEAEVPAAGYQSFLAHCLSSQWEVHV